MARLACGGGVGGGEQAAFETFEIEVLLVGKGVRGIRADEELTEGRRC